VIADPVGVSGFEESSPLPMFPSSMYFVKKANWLIALMVEGLAPLFRAYAFRKCGRAVSNPHAWKRALVVGDNHIGDILYRTCSLVALKQGLPECEFYYLTAPNTAALLEGNPAIRAVLPWARSGSPLDLLPCHEAELKKLGFDALLSTNAVRYWPELALAVRLGIPNRVGYIYKGFSGWVTHPMPIRYPQSYPAYFRGYVAALTGQEPAWPLCPRLYPRQTDQEEADGIWLQLGLDVQRPTLACFMTTRQPIGAMPMNLMGGILSEVRQQTGAQILLLGAKDDAAILERTNRQYGLAASILAGSLGLRALPSFLQRCDAVLTSDSGPRHLANVAKVPVFFFRNLWFSSVEAGCYAATEVDLCPPDIQRLGDSQQRLVLAQLSAVDVANRVVKVLRNKGKPS
jgi:ADP-heptose:LPS heptosyltransferase